LIDAPMRYEEIVDPRPADWVERNLAR